MIGLAKLAAGPGHVALEDRPEPEAGTAEVVIAVHAAGICGTDLHIEAGEYASAPPITLGHEVAGVVVAVGPVVDRAWLDRRVVCETFFSTCRACVWCRDGRTNLCPERRSIGTHVDGGFAPRMVIPAGNLHPVPDGVGAHAAALAEPLACVCHCLLDPSVTGPGERALVVGPGPMGILAAQVARALGAEVVVAGLPADAERLAFARELGFEAVDAFGGAVDVAIDASGSAGGATLGLEAVRRGGRYVQIGIFGSPVRVPLDLVLEKEILVSSGFASTPRAWRRALTLIGSGTIELDALVSSVSPLQRWRGAFDDLRASRGMKAVLDPRL
jgi:L-iditol 2-dehydrogenase